MACCSFLSALLDGVEVWVAHGVLRCNSLRVIISEHLVQEIECLLADESFILVTNKLVPWLLSVLKKNLIIVVVEGDVVLLNILEEIFGTEDLRDFN